MAKGFDGLIEYLLEEIALCGEIGTSLSFDHPKTFRDREFSPRKKGSAEIRNDHSVPANDGLFYLTPTGCTTSRWQFDSRLRWNAKHFITFHYY